MMCKSGKHSWTNPDSAEMCCNGYHRELRHVRDGNFDAELRGRVRVDGEAVVYVWVKDSHDTR